MQSDTILKQTPLYQEHVRFKAKMVPFGGWDMPLQYQGILAEYTATRRDVSVFDTSHMGEFIIQGDLKECGLDRLVTQKLSDLNPGMCRYGTLLKDDGGVLDDLIVYRLAKDRWMAVVNGATTDKDARQFKAILTDKAKFLDMSFQTGKLDIQGPRSRDLLSGFIKGFENLSFYSFCECDVLGVQAIVSRTGYTGELGYEIYYPWDRTVELWKKIISSGAKPAGLGSRDVLRLEMGYSLYGHELNEETNPLEAGLERFVDWEKDFIGKTALLEKKRSGIGRFPVAVTSLSRRSPREGFKIFSSENKPVGLISSGTFSPALEKGIGLGFTEKVIGQGEKVLLGDGKNNFEAVVASKPFYKHGSLRN